MIVNRIGDELKVELGGRDESWGQSVRTRTCNCTGPTNRRPTHHPQLADMWPTSKCPKQFPELFFCKWSSALGMSWISTEWFLLLYFSCFHFCPVNCWRWTFGDLPEASSYCYPPHQWGVVSTFWTQLKVWEQFRLTGICTWVTNDKGHGLVSVDPTAGFLLLNWPFLPRRCPVQCPPNLTN